MKVCYLVIYCRHAQCNISGQGSSYLHVFIKQYYSLHALTDAKTAAVALHGTDLQAEIHYASHTPIWPLTVYCI